MKMVGDSRWKKEEEERRATTWIEISRSGEGNLFQSSTHRPFVQRYRYSILDWNYNHHDKGLMKRRSSISYVRDKFDALGAACIAPEPYASDTLSADAQRQIYVAPGEVSRTRIPLYSATSSSFSPSIFPRLNFFFLSYSLLSERVRLRGIRQPIYKSRILVTRFRQLVF